MPRIYDYTVESDCLTLVKQLAVIDTPVKDLLMQQMLYNSSARGSTSNVASPDDPATVPGVLVYRPYYVAARELQRDKAAQTVSEADGAKFRGHLPVIQSLLEEQIGLDDKYNLQVPLTYSAVDAWEKMCGCDYRAYCCGKDCTDTATSAINGLMTIMVA